MVSTLIRLAEGEVVESHGHVPAWVFGVVAFVVLVLLLFVVTRFNPDR
jgi:hypothetical protein